MHRQKAAEGLELVGFARQFERDQHADAAESVGHRTVHIARDHTFADRQFGGAAQRHVLADLRDRLVDRIRSGAAADGRREDLVHIRAGIERYVGDHLDQALE